MLKTRVMPTLLWKNVGLVKGEGFDSWRRVGAVLPAIKVYNAREVDELVLLDIMATREGRDPDYESLAEFCQECFVPMTIGGGVRTLDHMKNLLRAGADKVAVNSAVFENPTLVSEAANHFGAQCVVVSLDAKPLSDDPLNASWQCYQHSGQVATGRDLIEVAQAMAQLGAGELLITSIPRDGTMQGYDLKMIEAVRQVVSIPVIASGGAGEYAHLHEALMAGANAVAAASIFHFTEQTPLEAKRYLLKQGIPVRMS